MQRSERRFAEETDSGKVRTRALAQLEAQREEMLWARLLRAPFALATRLASGSRLATLRGGCGGGGDVGMLLALLIVNNFGKPRLLKFYRHTVRAKYSKRKPLP